MHTDKQKNQYLFLLFAFMFAFFLSLRVFNDGVAGWKSIITSDGRGYYAYLPAILIDRDLTFKKVATREAGLLGLPHYKPGYLVKSGDHTVNKYFAGEALLLLPFFLSGYLMTWIFGADLNGYSFFFQSIAGIGTLFYLFLGLYFLKRILESLQIRQAVVNLTLMAVLFGTNLFYYSLWQPTMSHVFSFFTINGFMWFAIRGIREWNRKTAASIGFFLGMVCLVRPTNAVVILLIPFLAGDRHGLLRFFSQVMAKKRGLLLIVLISFAIVSIQMLIWYAQTGQFIIWPYRDEGFNFGKPELFNVLFSYNKGLFVYTPLVLISLLGLIPLIFKRWMQLFSMIGFLAVSCYIIASWWNWYYGDGFGLRAFIDYYGIFAILLALALNASWHMVGKIAWPLIITVLAVINLVQTWQYTHGVIRPNSMNRQKYNYVLLRTDSAVINCLGGNEELPDYKIDQVNPVMVYVNNFEQESPGWTKNHVISISTAASGRMAACIDSIHQFSPGIAVRALETGHLPTSYYIRVEVRVRDSLPGASNSVLVVLSMDSINPGENWWQGFRLNDIPQENISQWSLRKFSLMTPVINNHRRILKVYLWNTGKKPMLLDDFSIRIYGTEQEGRREK